MAKQDNILAIPLKVLSADETFVVLLVKSITHGTTFCASGSLPINLIGCTIRLFGKYTDTGKKNGKSFKVVRWELAPPKSAVTLNKVVNALKMKLTTTEVRALFSAFGENALNILREGNTEEIKKVLPDVSESTLENISQICEATFLIQEASNILAKYNQPMYLAGKVVKHYGDKVPTLNNNPYLLCNVGVNFRDIDKRIKWKQKDNYNPLFAGRIAMGIKYAMELNEMSGNVYIEPDKLVESVVEILEIMPSQAKKYINQAIEQGFLRMFSGKIYLAETEEIERDCAREVFDILHSPIHKYKEKDIDNAISNAEDGITLGDMQRQGVKQALLNPISIITGGAGCGKTTCINQLIKAYKSLNSDAKILAAAPTGRAARRLAEATGLEAKTLHSVLKILKDGRYPKIDVLDADLIIVDEFSMCDIFLSEAFFSKVKVGQTRVVMVGDKHQLPSVDCGNVFADLIASNIIPCTTLKTIYRQAEDSAIIKNADAINENNLPLQNADDFMLVQNQQIIDTTLKSVKYALKSFRAEDIMVLSPFRKTEYGSNAMNEKLQALLNPPSPVKNEYHYGRTIFREGDRVIQTENDAERDVYNGDIGYITNIIEKTHKDKKKGVEVKFETGNTLFYTASMLSDLQLAYAITIHKSQGSEFPCTIVMFSKDYGNFRQKKLLYTAVTRAKVKVILVGDSDSISFAASSRSPFERKRRNSLLAGRLVSLEDKRNKAKEAFENGQIKNPKPKKAQRNEQVQGQISLAL